MDSGYACCCCLLRLAEKDLNTPYVYLGVKEIFSDMLEECFQIQVVKDFDHDVGICEVCEGRLRDARDFKLQVQRSQAELRARQERARQVKGEDRRVKLEITTLDSEDDDIIPDAAPTSQVSDDSSNEGEATSFSDPLEPRAAAISSPRLGSSRAKEQLATASVSLQDKMSPRTSPHQSSLTTHMRVRAEQLTERTERDLTSAAAGAETYTCGVQFEQTFEQFLKKYDENKASKKYNHTPRVRCKQSQKITEQNTRGVQFEQTFEQFLKKCDENKASKKCKQSRKITEQKITRKSDIPYTCDICNKQFKLQCVLTEHKRIHTGEKKFSCEICSKKFGRSWTLKQHQLTHLTHKQYTCDTCGKHFTRKSSLDSHTATHIKEKTIPCEICSKTFSHPHTLRKHKLIHTNLKQYTCDVCGKQYTLKTNLNDHMNFHMNIKPFSCKVCSRKFIRKRNLHQHELIHTGHREYSCEVCHKQFLHKSFLTRHTRIHTGEKPYSCAICSKKFSNWGGLDQHKVVHTGNRPSRKKRTQKT